MDPLQYTLESDSASSGQYDAVHVPPLGSWMPVVYDQLPWQSPGPVGLASGSPASQYPSVTTLPPPSLGYRSNMLASNHESFAPPRYWNSSLQQVPRLPALARSNQAQDIDHMNGSGSSMNTAPLARDARLSHVQLAAPAAGTATATATSSAVASTAAATTPPAAATSSSTCTTISPSTLAPTSTSTTARATAAPALRASSPPTAAQPSGPSPIIPDTQQHSLIDFPQRRFAAAEPPLVASGAQARSNVTPIPPHFSPSRYTSHQRSTSRPENSGPHCLALPSLEQQRRRSSQARVRRSMASRLHSSEPVLDLNDNVLLPPRPRASHSDGHHAPAAQRIPQDDVRRYTESMSLRQLQTIRGSAAIRRGASKRTLQSLQKVDVQELPENERTADKETACVICYNDFGVRTPEGIVETPVRLPKCKHVFGDSCVKKWLEDAYCCPYCRDELPSESRLPIARQFLNVIRLQENLHIPADAPDELIERLLASYGHDDDVLESMGDWHVPARRSLQVDAEELRRRTRPRRSNSATRGSGALTRGDGRSAELGSPPTAPPDFSPPRAPAHSRGTHALQPRWSVEPSLLGLSTFEAFLPYTYGEVSAGVPPHPQGVSSSGPDGVHAQAAPLRRFPNPLRAHSAAQRGHESHNVMHINNAVSNSAQEHVPDSE
ncbi:hypothetical protein S40288_07503 [Stachybotrys chartarum IBT 40288]|nr:hypothetical protein S40288_07503 [Stachybotrys chartarum IBT 40288]